ncbi:ELWxxDGT repeat protein, partial [Pyxidicoccus sp. 3LFB2]
MAMGLCMALMSGCAEPVAAQPEKALAGLETSRPQALIAGPPFLVHDLWQGEASYYREVLQFTPVGDSLYFTNSTSNTGTELWKTDGTTEGTALVMDLAPGPQSSSPAELTELGGWLYFSAKTAEGDSSGVTYGLWRTRGTPESTEYVHPLGNDPFFISRMGDALYFIARGGYEAPWTYSLWRSDGTAAGTRPLKPMSTYGGHSPKSWAQLDGILLFSAVGDEAGMELWKTDGTVEGTSLVKDISPGPYGASLTQFVSVNGVVLFLARESSNGPYRLWRTDGTADGTFRLKPHRTGQYNDSGYTELTVAGNAAYFSGWDAQHGQELWRTDGTDSGPHPLDLVPGVKGSFPSQLTAFAGQLFFEARDERPECMLWKSDGTLEGSLPVADLRQDIHCAVEQPGQLLGTPDGLYFFANPTGMARELWKTDGTARGMVQLTQGLPATGDYNDRFLTWRDGSLYFITRGHELWTSDGSPEGTRVLLRNTGTGASSSPMEAASFKGTLFFGAMEGMTGEEPWMSDGTPEGTLLLADLTPGLDDSRPSRFTPAGSQLFFLTGRGYNGTYGLWRTDGSSAGTRELSYVTSYRSRPLAALGEELFFIRQSAPGGDELWKTDGTAEGTARVMGVSGLPLGWEVDLLTVARGRLFFVADNDLSRFALWTSDGTPAGTRKVRDLAPEGRYAFINHLAAVGDTLFFFASIEGERRSLWKSDGTTQGTVRVASGGTYYQVHGTAVLDDTLFFIANDSSPYDLWKSDGTTVERVKQVSGHPTPPPGALTAFRGALYFWAFDAAHGYELWKSDGTEAGTRMLRELAPGPKGAVAAPTPLVALGPDGPLLFSASDGISGMELWQTDGTAEGTVRVSDLVPGHDSSSPQGLTVAGRHLFFSAWQKDTGTELWALPRTVADVTPPELTCPQAAFVEATSARGAAKVAFPSATATDDTDPRPALFYSPGPGTDFPMGDASVTVVAADELGNRSTCRFELTVRDTQPPTLRCPPAQRAEATATLGAFLHFPEPEAQDVASVPVVRMSQPNWNWFPVGTTNVEVTATDGVGLTATCQFPIEVVDTTPPSLTCPPSMQTEAHGPWGATVTFGAPTAYDTASTPTVQFSPASGSILSVGTTPVTATASDASGNTAQCTFSVEVVDTRPPRLTCPPRQQVMQTSEGGASISYPAVLAPDDVSDTRVEFVPANGSFLPLGSTEVFVTATDTSGNTARCSFDVEVLTAPVPQPDAGTPPPPRPRP